MTSETDTGLEDGLDRLRLDPSSTFLPVRPNHRVRNINEEFNEASAALGTGQLIKDEGFSLFDSVQALEVMDPKMDTGFLGPGETLEETYDICRDLSGGQVVWIMDELLCYEMAFHQGYPLAQNLLTSVYIYNLLVQERLPNSVPYFRPLDGSQTEPGPLVQKVLRAFCIGVIKSCDVVIEMAQMQQFYEEEDLNTHNFGLDLLTNVSDDEYFRLHKDAIDWLAEQDDSKAIKKTVCAALASRLTCRKHFLNLVLPHSEGTDEMVDSNMFRALNHSIAMPAYETLRQPVEESFSSKFQRKLASTVPPRPIIKLPLGEATQFLNKMYDDIQEALKVELFGESCTLGNLTQFLWAYAAREAATFPRAVLQMLLFNDGKIAGPGDGMKTLLIRDLRCLLVDRLGLQESFWDVEAPQDPRHQIARTVDVFVEQAPQEFINVLRSLCQNRCRIRRCLMNVIKDVDTLVTDLVDVYGDPTQQSASNFPALVKHALLLITLRLEGDVTEWAIQLGFELDLYQPFELPFLQGYLTSVIKTKRVSLDAYIDHLDRCKTEIMRVIGTKRLLCRYPNDSRNKEEDIWEGLTILYLTLARLNADQFKDPLYTTWQALVSCRMKSFLGLKYFETITSEKANHSGMPIALQTLPELLARGTVCFDAARKRISNLRKGMQDRKPKEDDVESGLTPATKEHLLKETTMMLKAAVKGSVAMEALKRALKDVGGDVRKLDGKVSASFEQPEVGSFFVSPQIKITTS